MAMLIWIIILIVAAIAEAVTTALVSVWFCVGALAAAVAAALGVPIFFQLVIFVLVSAAALAVTRPIVNKLMPGDDYIPTNGEDDVGKTALVIEEIDPEAGKGRVRLADVDWAARSADGNRISLGSTVQIVEKGGAILTVTEQRGLL